MAKLNEKDNMVAPKGNEFWKIANYKGMNLKFETPEKLWEAAEGYFQWCDENPLKEEKLFHYQGEVTKETVSKMRAYTLKHLCLHIGCSKNYLEQFNVEDNQEFSVIITRIRDIIYTQKFQGSAADLLNPSIIARDLGLVDKIEETTKQENLSEEELNKLIDKLREELKDEL